LCRDGGIDWLCLWMGDEMKHVHHDMIVEWAKDTSRVVEIQLLGVESNRWWATIHPDWREDRQYRFKPEEPKFIVVNGVNVPEPVRGELEDGCVYWLADASVTDAPLNFKYTAHTTPMSRWLSLGLIHLTSEAAQQHIDAMLLPSRTDK